MTNTVESIALEKLVCHPDNPNRMSGANFAKLVRNIGRTGRYEPLIVRPCRGRGGFYQIINGHHRRRALAELGYETADAIVWDIDDEQTDILLATLNRLAGSDEPAKKLKLLNRLNDRFGSGELAKLLPLKAKQIERLTNLKMPSKPAGVSAASFIKAMVFFVNDAQQETIENALSLAEELCSEKRKSLRRAAALAQIAGDFINHSEFNSRA